MKLTDYIDKTSEELEKMTTPQLLMLRKICFSSHRDCGLSCHCEPHNAIDKLHNTKVAELHVKLNAILPHREHVPGKAEAKAKAIRQARAKQGR